MKKHEAKDDAEIRRIITLQGCLFVNTESIAIYFGRLTTAKKNRGQTTISAMKP